MNIKKILHSSEVCLDAGRKIIAIEKLDSEHTGINHRILRHYETYGRYDTDSRRNLKLEELSDRMGLILKERGVLIAWLKENAPDLFSRILRLNKYGFKNIPYLMEHPIQSIKKKPSDGTLALYYHHLGEIMGLFKRVTIFQRIR